MISGKSVSLECLKRLWYFDVISVDSGGIKAPLMKKAYIFSKSRVKEASAKKKGMINSTIFNNGFQGITKT